MKAEYRVVYQRSIPNRDRDDDGCCDEEFYKFIRRAKIRGGVKACNAFIEQMNSISGELMNPYVEGDDRVYSPVDWARIETRKVGDWCEVEK